MFVAAGIVCGNNRNNYFLHFSAYLNSPRPAGGDAASLLIITITVSSRYHYCTMNASWYHHRTIAAPSTLRHCTITAPSLHHHRTITVPSLYRDLHQPSHCQATTPPSPNTPLIGILCVRCGAVVLDSSRRMGVTSPHHHCTITAAPAPSMYTTTW